MNQKKRPLIPDSWLANRCMSELSSIIRDCWDQEADARVSASFVNERLKDLREMQSLNNANANNVMSIDLNRERQLNINNVTRNQMESNSERAPLITNNNVNNII